MSPANPFNRVASNGMKHRAGFTLLELLITMGVLGVIVSFTFPSYKAMQDRIALNGAAEQIGDALHVAQNRAITAEGGCEDHGVQFLPPNQFAIVHCGMTEVFTLPNNVILSAGADVAFTRLSGQASTATNLVVAHGSLQRTLAVSLNGKIDLN